MDLTVTVTEHPDARIVVARGEIDVHTAGVLREAITACETAVRADGHPLDLVVDLSGVPFMDSTGLGVLVGALARAREADRRLVLAGAPERVQRLLRLTGLDGQFESAPDVASALPAG